MFNVRPFLRWSRRAVLVAVALLLALSLVSLLVMRKGGFGLPHTSTSVGSVDGVFFYGRLRLTPPISEPRLWNVEFQFLWSQDYRYGRIFDWSTLGFQFRFLDSPQSGARPAYSLTDIRVPYWPFVLILGLPEIPLWLRRTRAKTLKNLPPAQPRHVEVSTITVDLPCVHCGYNLQTLSSTGLCPECGSAVSDTLTLSAELARSRPGWLKSLAVGNVLLLLTRLLLIFIYIQFWLPGYGRSGDLLSGISAIAAAATYLIGTLLLTLNEHPFLRSPDQRSAMLQRIGASILFLFVIAGVYHQGYLPSGGRWIIVIIPRWLILSGYGFWHFATLVLLFIAWLIYCTCTILEYRFLGKLAGRLLDRFMTEHCTIAGIGAGLSNLLVLLIVRDFVSYAFIRRGPLILWSTFVIIIAWILFQIWTGFMNVYCAHRFLQQSWIAEENWKSRQDQPQPVQR